MDALGSKQVFQYVYHMRLWITVSIVTDNIVYVVWIILMVWFAYKVSNVMCSASACEHCWSIEGWIHSKRRNRLHQTFVQKLVRAPVDQTEEKPEV